MNDYLEQQDAEMSEAAWAQEALNAEFIEQQARANLNDLWVIDHKKVIDVVISFLSKKKHVSEVANEYCRIK